MSIAYTRLEDAINEINIGDEVSLLHIRHGKETVGKVTKIVLPNIIYLKTMVRGKMREIQEYVSYKQTIQKL